MAPGPTLTIRRPKRNAATMASAIGPRSRGEFRGRQKRGGEARVALSLRAHGALMRKPNRGEEERSYGRCGTVGVALKRGVPQRVRRL